MVASPVMAQDPEVLAPPAIIFQSGTGDGTAPAPAVAAIRRAEVDCASLEKNLVVINAHFYPVEFEVGNAPPRRLLDRGLFEKALAGYRNHFCNFGRFAGPAIIVIVDFAKHSSQPRLYRVDLRDGYGLDAPIKVAHGIGSDPDDDGFANFFSNVQESLTSSLGAALGGERYVGINGVSLRLDGLEPSNSQMRARDIVVHSYAPERRRYFNADLVAERGRPGSSEGCFVVEPSKRDWILYTLENGGYLFSGLSGKLSQAVDVPKTQIVFAPGTGASGGSPR
ncbi:murein L,D-transpeptidase catalytic domain-containing protein [Sphingorhabdus profundilacus]|nr:murein L,D-transpeptidase catalytic domain family protein [Sphingorhabdus profundilacus]